MTEKTIEPSDAQARRNAPVVVCYDVASVPALDSSDVGMSLRVIGCGAICLHCVRWQRSRTIRWPGMDGIRTAPVCMMLSVHAVIPIPTIC